jgi:hypothetical protein
VERFMRYLNQTFTILLPKYDQWPRIVPLILFAYRVLPHSTTLYSPFFLQYGREPLLPINSTLLQAEDLVASSEPCITYAQDMVSIMKDVFANVRRRQDIISRKNADARDYNRYDIEYEIGDPVWYIDPRSVLGLTSDIRPERPSKEETRSVPSKWRYDWTGPHRIVGKTSSKVYRIYHEFRKQNIPVLVRDIKMYHPFHPLPLPKPIVSGRSKQSKAPRKLRQPAIPAEVPPSVPPPPSAALPPLLGPLDISKLREGDLCVVRLREDADQPIGVMRFLSFGTANTMVLQYLGCINLDWRIEVFVTHKFQNSWYQPSTQQIYYKMLPLHRSHVPVTNAFTEQEVLTSDLIAFPFALQSNYSLPQRIRDAILKAHRGILASK